MSAGVISKVSAPVDVKQLAVEDLRELAKEIRATILQTMAANGGHLATNLGTVELSLALHYVFDSPRDRIVWDVGNQCYTHKIITGRREAFSTVRQEGGISGFTHRSESPHDQFTSGHAGTALSSALGIAAAREISADNYDVVAVVGDGALSAGLSYEALNNIANLKSKFLTILNDNCFSISRSGGGLAGALDGARSRILDGSVFEQLGVSYIGPVDGHDMELLIDVLGRVRELKYPVVLHVLTQKGRGYKPAELNPERFHGVAPFDITSGKFYTKSSAPTYSDVFGESLISLAQCDKRVVAISAAMTAGTGLTKFAEQFPDRYFDVGIAEQHAVTFAGGLAAAGAKPVVAIYSTFLQRSYDQIIHDVCLQNVPVVFVMDRAGIVGADGATHHGLFDIGYLRMVPRIIVMAPKDAGELQAMLQWAINQDRPCAIRIPRGAAPQTVADRKIDIELAKGELLREGKDVAIVAIGSMVERALEVADRLAGDNISTAVVNARFAKPLDTELITNLARQVKLLVTLEEHVAAAGFGSCVLEHLASGGLTTPTRMIGLPDRFIEHGCAQKLLHDCGLSVEKIRQQILEDLRETDAEQVLNEPDLPDAELAIKQIAEATLPPELQSAVDAYAKVGERDAFLWKWCLQGVRLTSLSCVDEPLADSIAVTKVLGVMLDVLMDDVADRGGSDEFLTRLLDVPFSEEPVDFSEFDEKLRCYGETTEQIWRTIYERVQQCPKYDEFLPLLKFDYQQLFNAMRYAHLVNRQPFMVNLSEHDLYQPHNMHMMVSGTMDLMCASGFDSRELGDVREALWHAQYMGRIGNLITTWERELNDRDITSGVFARAMQIGAFHPDDFRHRPIEDIRRSIKEGGCEEFFVEQWKAHYAALLAKKARLRTVDIGALADGLRQLFVIHMGSRGLK